MMTQQYDKFPLFIITSHNTWKSEPFFRPFTNIEDVTFENFSKRPHYFLHNFPQSQQLSSQKELIPKFTIKNKSENKLKVPKLLLTEDESFL